MIEVENAINTIYESYLEFKGRKNNKKKHPSREEFGSIIKYAQAWNSALKALEENKDVRCDSDHPGEKWIEKNPVKKHRTIKR